MMVVAVMLVICFTTVSAAYKNEIYVSNKLELSNCKSAQNVLPIWVVKSSISVVGNML